MKLVTGIEAIQSGKPWKHHRDESWFEPNSDSPLFTQVYLRLKEFIIKEEPREFWINASLIDRDCEHCGIPISSVKLNLGSQDQWMIRVREIEK
jgi:hypothetical protein